MKKIVESTKIWSGKLGNMRYFYPFNKKNLAAGRWSDFPPEKFYFEIFFSNAVSIIFGLRYIHAQSLSETDFPTRNAVDRF